MINGVHKHMPCQTCSVTLVALSSPMKAMSTMSRCGIVVPKHPFALQVTINVQSPPSKAEVQSMSLPTMNARRLYVGGSNVMEVMGDIRLYGTSSQPQATHLAAPAAPGDTVITLTEPAAWQPGEEVFLTATGHSWEESEYATVTECVGTSVTLAAPLRFAHFGAPDLFRDPAMTAKTKFAGLENRAQVLLMTRSITVEGNGEARDGLGAKMFVTEMSEERVERGLTITSMCALRVMSCRLRSWDHSCKCGLAASC